MESENGTVFHTCNKHFSEGEVSEKRFPARASQPSLRLPGNGSLGEEARFKKQVQGSQLDGPSSFFSN